jgi:hypothetical protein
VKRLHEIVRLNAILLVVLLVVLQSVGAAQAQGSFQFLHLEDPGRLSLRLFAVGYGAEKYGTSHAGFELDQTITRAISIIGRVAAYQVYQGTGFDSPLTPAPRSAPRNFGLFEGGASFSPFQGTFFTLLGGENAGDADAPVFQNECSSWVWLQSRHPLNLAYSTSHYFENGVTNGLLDARIVALSTARVLLLAGVGGAIWGGGSVGQAKGQGGPDVGVFVREWGASFDLQAGYGSSRTYGMVSFSRTFHWDE